jgi:hypothetical protein
MAAEEIVFKEFTINIKDKLMIPLSGANFDPMAFI